MDEKAIKKHFEKVDPIIFAVIKDVDFSKWHKKPINIDSYFHTLVNQIISQQLHTKVADVISARLATLLAEESFTPTRVLEVTDEELRSVGLSKSKASYIKNLAELVAAGKINFESFPTASEEEVIAELVQVKGIGRWTAEMFLMFALAKPDVFSHGDYGLRSGIKKIYRLTEHPTLDEAIRITELWKPYRSFGSFALWRSLEQKDTG
jgi:DNA-3-methyladenine glycosylase II